MQSRVLCGGHLSFCVDLPLFGRELLLEAFDLVRGVGQNVLHLFLVVCVDLL